MGSDEVVRIENGTVRAPVVDAKDTANYSVRLPWSDWEECR